MQKLIAVIGNTGVGKSKLAIELAKKFNGEIINADSLQMYRGADIITNKHPLDEREGIPHHLLGHIEWSQQYTVKHFEAEATPIINELAARNKVPVLVGGTHYYIQSLISEALIGELGQPTQELTSEQVAVLDDPASVEQQLACVDPQVLEKFHPNDTRRLRRALEIYYTSGQRASEIYASQAAAQLLKYDVLIFWVYCDREVLAARLDARVDEMMDQGLLNELKEMHEYKQQHSCDVNSSVWQAIGYRQFLPYLDGTATLDDGVQVMKTHTTQYARKQTKWIVNKFFPYLQQIGARYAIVDSTDLEQWDQLTQRAFTITREWLAGTPEEHLQTPLVPPHIATERKAASFDWTRHRCGACSTLKSRDIVIVGTEAWDIHCSSKQHKYAVSKTALSQS